MIYNISQLKAEILYGHHQYNTSIKRGQKFLLNHVDSKLSLVVIYADLVGSTQRDDFTSRKNGKDNQSLCP